MRNSPDAICEEFNRWAERNEWASRADSGRVFEAPLLRDALSVWQGATKGRALPERSALTPRAMKGFLSNVAIVDVVREHERIRFRLRLLGSELDRRYGAQSGRFLDEAYPEPHRSRWSQMLSLPLRLAAPARIRGRLEYRRATYLKAEAFLAPLGTDIAAPDTVLFVLHLEPKEDDLDTEPFPRLGQVVA